MADDGVLIGGALQSAVADTSCSTGHLTETNTTQRGISQPSSVDKTLKQAAQRVAGIEADQSFRDHSDGTMMSHSGYQSVGGTSSSSIRSPVRMLVRSRSVLGRLPSYAQPTVSSLLRSSHSNDLLDVNTLASQVCSRCRPRSVSPVLHKGKDPGSRSKADRLTSARTPRGGASISLSTSAVSTPGQLHSPRPRSAVRYTTNTHKSGVHSEVNSKPTTPVLLNSPVKSSTVGRTTVGSGCIAKDSKLQPCGSLDNDVKPCTSANEMRRKQLNEMSKSFELDLNPNKVDSPMGKKRTQKSKPVRSNSTAGEVRAKLPTEDVKTTEEGKGRPKSFGTNTKTQLMAQDNGKHLEGSHKHRNVMEHPKSRETKSKQSPDEQLKPKVGGERALKSQPSSEEGNNKVSDREDDNSTLDEVKPKQGIETNGAISTTLSAEKQKPKPVVEDIKGKLVQDRTKSKGVLTDKNKAKPTAQDVHKKTTLTSDEDREKPRPSDNSKSVSDGKVKPKPVTVAKSGQEDQRKKLIQEPLNDIKSDTVILGAELKQSALQESKKDKVNVVSPDGHLKNVESKPRVESDSAASKKDSEHAGPDTAVDEYKAKLTENRRLAREKAEREAAEEEARLRRLQQEEDERRCREEEEERLREAEELRIAEEMRKSEEQRLQRAVEAEEKRKRDEQIQLEKERVQRLEAERVAKEEAVRLEIERQARIKRDEEEKIERKKRLESIMKRVKTDESISKSDTASARNDTSTPSEEGAPAAVVESGVPQFKSARLQQLLGNKSVSPTTTVSDEIRSPNSGSESAANTESGMVDETSANRSCGNTEQVVGGTDWEIRDTNGITLIPIPNATPAPRLLQETN